MPDRPPSPTERAQARVILMARAFREADFGKGVCSVGAMEARRLLFKALEDLDRVSRERFANLDALENLRPLRPEAAQ